MKPVLAIVLVTLISGCASAPRTSIEPTVEQKLSVECVAGTRVRSGCTTTHDIALIARLGPADQRLPSVEDFGNGTPTPSEF